MKTSVFHHQIFMKSNIEPFALDAVIHEIKKIGRRLEYIFFQFSNTFKSWLGF